MIEHELVAAASSGSPTRLVTTLSELENPDEFINRIYEYEDGQRCTLLTIACLNNHEIFMHYLIDHYHPDLEKENDVVFRDENNTRIDCLGVSVLWLAAALDNSSIVKLLVEHGANINHRALTNSTPLRSACYNGNLEMVKYLTQKGGDIRISKQHNDTNLALAASRKHFALVQYLVDELGCDVNECDDDGRSVLFDAVHSRSLEIVEFLLRRGARNVKARRDQMSPLMWAAEKRLVELVKTIGCYATILESIEAEELLGSALMSDEVQKRKPDEAIQHWIRALQLRSIHHLPKVLSSSGLCALLNRSECQTREDLEILRLNPENLWAEALLIRERILGPANPEFIYSLHYQGAVLLDDEKYLEGFHLWLYGMRLKREYGIPFRDRYLRDFIAVVHLMVENNILITQDALETVLAVVLHHLQNESSNFDFNLNTFLFLITITSRYLIAKVNSWPNPGVIYRQLRSIDYREMVRSTDKSSLLHMCLEENLVPDTAPNDLLFNEYPCYSTAALLLQCGIDPNITDVLGNTPLHVFSATFSTVDLKILDLLFSYQAHLDQANQYGMTPMDYANNAAVERWFFMKKPFSLKCLCARMIRREKIPFRSILNQALINEIVKH